jgi:hypothetical protein
LIELGEAPGCQNDLITALGEQFGRGCSDSGTASGDYDYFRCHGSLLYE